MGWWNDKLGIDQLDQEAKEVFLEAQTFNDSMGVPLSIRKAQITYEINMVFSRQINTAQSTISNTVNNNE